MPRINKTIRTGILFILLLALLNGCNSSNGVEDNNMDIVLKTMSMFGGTDSHAAVYQKINETFMKQNPGIHILDDSSSSSQEWKSKVAIDFSVGNEPDVLQYFTDYNAKDVLEADSFVTISEIREVYPEYAKDIKPEALKLAQAPDNTSYAVPTTGYYEGLFCNTELFERYQLELPTNWDNLLTAIKVFRKNGIIPIAVSLNEVPHYWVEHLLFSAAGTKEYLEVADKAPESWIKGLEMIKTLRDMGAFPEDTDTIDNAYACSLFTGEKAAMQLDGSWYANGLTRSLGEKTIILAFPTMEGGKKEPKDIISGLSSGFYITKKAWQDPEKREAAVKFVMAHTNADAIKSYWSGAGLSAVEAVLPEDASVVVQSGYKMVGEAEGMVSPTDSRIATEAYTALIGSIVDVSKGKLSAEEAITEALAINKNQDGRE